MAEIEAQSLRGVVARMMEEAAQTQKMPSGPVGEIFEKMTGQMKAYNKVAEDAVRNRVKLRDATMKLRKAEEELATVEREIGTGGATAKQTAQINQLTKAISKYNEEVEEMAEQTNASQTALQDMNKSSGILRNGLVALAGKVGGAAVAMFSWRDAIVALDERAKMAGETIGRFGVQADQIGQTAERISEAKEQWGDAIVDTSWEMHKMGIGVETTRSVMDKLNQGIRITTENQNELIGSVAQMTEDVGFMSQLLGVNTEELADAAVNASRKFGRSTSDTADDLAGMYDAINTVKQASKDTVISFSDLTRSTLEAQAGYQGYSFNLRQTAQAMASMTAEAQKQGATIEGSTKAARQLTDLISGTSAPKWARYVAGSELRKELVDVVEMAKKESAKLSDALGKSPEEAAKESGKAVAEALKKSFGKDLTDTQLKGLSNMAENWREHGQLSSALMTQEMLASTEVGMEAMFKQIQATTSGTEAREMLQSVWGLDPQAATAAALTIKGMRKEIDEDGKKGEQSLFEKMTKLKREAEAETEARRPPGIKELREQTDEFVYEIGDAKDGIIKELTNIRDMIKQSPLMSGIVGGAGMALTGGIQAVQTGVAAAVVQKIAQSRVGGAMGQAANLIGGGRVAGPQQLGRLGRLRQAISGGPALGMGAQVAGMGRGAAERLKSTKLMQKATAASGVAMQGLTSAAGKVSKGFAGMGSKMAGLAGTAAGKAGLVGLAAALGVAVGSLIRMIPGVDEFTEGLIDSTAKLMGFKGAVSDAEAQQDALNNKSKVIQDAISMVHKGINEDFKKDSLDHKKAAVMLRDLKDEELENYAEKIAKEKGMEKNVALIRLKMLRDEQVSDKELTAARRKAEGLPPEPGTGDAPVGGEEAAKKAEKQRKRKAAIAKVKLDRRQKAEVTQQVATALSPEMAELAGPLFEQMSKQSTEYYTKLTETGTWFWRDEMPTLAEKFWAEKLPEMAVSSFTQIAAGLGVPIVALPPPGGGDAPERRGGRGGGRDEPARGGGGGGIRQGPARVRPDGISIEVMIPRDAIDRSNAEAARNVR